MAFAAGMTVFPGGAVDARDAETELGWVGPPAADWTEALAAGEPLARALVCAAVRETFEEAGVLLAGPSPAAVCDVDGPEWEADRAALEGRDVSLAALLARRGLLLRADLLRPWAHWITPEGEPRRYDTRFFVAAMPAGQRSRLASGEADAHGWLAPTAALDEAARGERGLMPPTMVTLEQIAVHATVAEVLAAAAGRTIEKVKPRLRRNEAGRLVVRLPDGREIAPRGLRQ
jgi:8-oxo-dGTP pyrophosphatase MutT (NUDIX family)